MRGRAGNGRRRRSSTNSSNKYLCRPDGMRQKLRERLADPVHRMMWRNFGSSIGLLTIAMMAALYSSSAGRGGRLAPAGIAALIALSIAIWVAIRFVPRLASNVEWDWLPFFSQYKITREGWIYFGAVTIVVFAA